MKGLDSLGKRLRHARDLRGISQADLALACGVRQPSISELETGESKSLSDETLISVCNVLKIRPEWLVRGSRPMEHPRAEEPQSDYAAGRVEAERYVTGLAAELGFALDEGWKTLLVELMTRHTLKTSGARKVLEHLRSFQRPGSASRDKAA